MPTLAGDQTLRGHSDSTGHGPLMIHEFDGWSNPKDCLMSNTATWACGSSKPDFAEE
jgi:hypothetical protein